MRSHRVHCSSPLPGSVSWRFVAPQVGQRSVLGWMLQMDESRRALHALHWLTDTMVSWGRGKPT
jgi:hypothetical protein